MEEKIINIQEEITSVSKKFYQRKDSEAYKELDNLLQHIAEFMGELAIYANQYMVTINMTLGNAIEALQNRDGVLIADILRYDLNKILDQIKMEI